MMMTKCMTIFSMTTGADMNPFDDDYFDFINDKTYVEQYQLPVLSSNYPTWLINNILVENEPKSLKFTSK